jgi:hypothetical protein
MNNSFPAKIHFSCFISDERKKIDKRQKNRESVPSSSQVVYGKGGKIISPHGLEFEINY